MTNNKYNPTSKRGFTLIELLIVVAIIAILAAIAVPNFLEAQIRAKVSRARSDLRTMQVGMEIYRVDHNVYPPNHIEIGNPANSEPFDYLIIFPRVARTKVLSTPIAYLTSIPQDPFQGAIIDPRDPEGKDYGYWAPAHADGHRIGGVFNTPDLFIDIPGEETRYGRYVLTSAGPDGTIEIPEHVLPGAILHLYDPTNGSDSLGEIWRFGP
jgi:type II secretion system protein G